MLKANHYFNGSIHFELRNNLKLVINHNIITDGYENTSFVDLILLEGDTQELFRIGARINILDLTNKVNLLCNTFRTFIKDNNLGTVGLKDSVLKDLVRTLVVYPDVFKTSSIIYRQMRYTINSLVTDERGYDVTLFEAYYDEDSGNHLTNKYDKYRAGEGSFKLIESKDENGDIQYWNQDNEEDDYDDDTEEDVIEEVVEEVSEEEVWEYTIMEQENKRSANLQEDEKAALLCEIDETTKWELDRVKSMENYDFTIFPFGMHFFEKDEENNTTKALHNKPKTKEEVMEKFLYHLDLVQEFDKFDVGVIDREVYSDNIKEMEEFVANNTLEEILNPVGRYFFVTQLRNILVTDFHMWQEEDGTWNYED